MKEVWLVAKREIKTRLMAKSTIISTLILMAAIAGGAHIVGYFLNDDEIVTAVTGTSQENAELADVAGRMAAGTKDEFIAIPTSEADGIERVISGEFLMYLGGTPEAPVMMFDGAPDAALVAIMQDALEQYTIYSSIAPEDAEKLQTALASAQVQIKDVNPVTSERVLDPVKLGTAFVIISLLFFALIQSASLIIVGVIEEKASRVVEVLLATIRPSQLLAGKVLGIGIMALLQVVLFAGTGIIAGVTAGLFSLSDISLSTTVFTLLGWFLLGFAIYISLFGGVASLVSRQEDSGSVTAPLIIGMMLPFYLAIYLIPNLPDALVTKVLSLVPFFAPFMMPVRIAFDSAAPWEVWTAVILCLITIPLMIWLGGSIYSRAVLRTGARVKLSDAMRG